MYPTLLLELRVDESRSQFPAHIRGVRVVEHRKLRSAGQPWERLRARGKGISVPPTRARRACRALDSLTSARHSSIQTLNRLSRRSDVSRLPVLKGTLDLLVLRALSWTPMHGFEIVSW